MADKLVVSGSTVTVGQLKDFFRQMEDGSIGYEEVQALLERRNPFERTLRAAITACRFDWVNSNIEEHFTLEPIRRERKVFHFDRSISSEDAVKQMEKEGWSPANLAELLDYGKNEWNSKDWVVALGSSAQIDGDRNVPCLYRNDAGRNLYLPWWSGGWVGYCRFLAARN